jgi:hypothetical protein
MANTVTKIETQAKAGDIMEAVITRGDIGLLNPEERAKYYVRVCESVGLNPITKPFEYITLNGKLTLYARKDCTDQLRQIHNISVTELIESERDGVFIVTAKVINGKGRTDAAKGAVTITGLKGDALANALMKAETKSKRRATLSICGLGFLDETEIETIPQEATRLTTLPKKDAKDVYIRLQEEIHKATSRPDLKKWGADNADRIKLLPEDWQDILRMRFEERLADLRQQEGTPPAESSDGIPPFLNRAPKANTYPNPKIDLDGFYKFAREKLMAAKTSDDLVLTWDLYIEPHNKDMFPPDKENLMVIYRQREREIEQTPLGAG